MIKTQLAVAKLCWVKSLRNYALPTLAVLIILY
jgi:hypothetical protein